MNFHGPIYRPSGYDDFETYDAASEEERRFMDIQRWFDKCGGAKGLHAAYPGQRRILLRYHPLIRLKDVPRDPWADITISDVCDAEVELHYVHLYDETWLFVTCEGRRLDEPLLVKERV